MAAGAMVIIFLVALYIRDRLLYESLTLERSCFDEIKRHLENQELQLFSKTFEDSIENIINTLKSFQTSKASKNQSTRTTDTFSLTHLMEVLKNLQQSKSVSRGDYSEYLANIRRDDIHSRLTYIRFSAWVIPAIGFMGTLVGMKDGLGALGSAVGNHSTAAMLDIIRSFGVAFNATLYAIVLSSVLALLLASIERYSDRLIVDINQYIVHRITVKLPSPVMLDFERQKKDFEEMVKGSDKILAEATNKLRDVTESIVAAGQPIARDIVGAVGPLRQEIEKITADMEKSASQLGTMRHKEIGDVSSILKDHSSALNTVVDLLVKLVDFQKDINDIVGVNISLILRDHDAVSNSVNIFLDKMLQHQDSIERSISLILTERGTALNDVKSLLERMVNSQGNAIKHLASIESHVEKLDGTLSVSLTRDQAEDFMSIVESSVQEISAQATQELSMLLGIRLEGGNAITLLGAIGAYFDRSLQSNNECKQELLGALKSIEQQAIGIGLSAKNIHDNLPQLSAKQEVCVIGSQLETQHAKTIVSLTNILSNSTEQSVMLDNLVHTNAGLTAQIAKIVARSEQRELTGN